MTSKVGMVFRTLAATTIAFLFIVAFPLAVTAAPAVTNFSVNRTTVSAGQTVDINITATAQTRYVFAMLDGTRTQGTRGTGNNWTVTVNPARTGTITVYVNNTNNTNNAARVNIPVTVTGTGAAAVTHAVTIPAAPANLGPIAIASITETPAIRANYVQITVVTGREANDVWVNFDRETGEQGRFAKGTMLSQGAHYRTWVINFRPRNWASQQIEIGSNRSYTWAGAARQSHTLALTQPFVRPANPVIQSVTVNNRSVAPGQNVTFTIRTNLDVEDVWIRTVDNVEHTASRGTTTANHRNWTVTFNPQRTGTVVVFANTERSETGAVRRNENVTVGAVARAQIIGTPTASWQGGNNTRINVTTNRYAEVVWAILPGSNNRVQLHRTDSGAGNRNWTGDFWDPHYGGAHGNITIGVSNQTGGNLQNLAADDSRTIVRTGHHHHATGNLVASPSFVTISRGSSSHITITTPSYVTGISAHLLTGFDVIIGAPWPAGGTVLGDGRRQWTFSVDVPSYATTGTRTIEVFAQGAGIHHSTVQVTVSII